MHQALGLAWHGNDHNVDAQRILNLAQQAVQWRWLLIDEISMVSAEMLARLEARCRQLVLDLYLPQNMANIPLTALHPSVASISFSRATCGSYLHRVERFSVKFPGTL